MNAVWVGEADFHVLGEENRQLQLILGWFRVYIPPFRIERERMGHPQLRLAARS